MAKKEKMPEEEVKQEPLPQEEVAPEADPWEEKYNQALADHKKELAQRIFDRTLHESIVKSKGRHIFRWCCVTIWLW